MLDAGPYMRSMHPKFRKHEIVGEKREQSVPGTRSAGPTKMVVGWLLFQASTGARADKRVSEKVLSSVVLMLRFSILTPLLLYPPRASQLPRSGSTSSTMTASWFMLRRATRRRGPLVCCCKAYSPTGQRPIDIGLGCLQWRL